MNTTTTQVPQAMHYDNIELFRFNFNFDKFTSKQAYILINLICNSRLSKEIHFDKYAIATFAPSDKSQRYPKIECIDDYKKGVNCLVFRLSESIHNMGIYDMMFLYQTTGPNIGNYGYILYNSTTQKYVHKYFVEFDYNSLMKSINVSLNSLDKLDIYDFYTQRYNYLMHNVQPTIEITNKGYEEMIAKHKTKIDDFIYKRTQMHQ